jgi:predicted acetyltransferase
VGKTTGHGSGELGTDRALITRDVANIGSRTVIQANGGVLEDKRDGRLRFWAPTDGKV